jgi:hypothetical protein
MTHIKHKSNRGGYAMLLIIAFAAFFFSLVALATSQLSSSILSETARAQQLERDEGSIHALARALALLETGYPSTTPYICGVAIDTSTGSNTYKVTFALEAPQSWSVTAKPIESGENPETMPLIFTSPSPP